MDVEQCALCLHIGPLRESHIIPNASFRKIKQGSNTGQLIYFNDHPNSKVDLSQDSWSEKLLCGLCEQKVGLSESYGIKLMRGEVARPFEHAGGISFRDHNYINFKLFLTSLLWRSAVAKGDAFQKSHLYPSLQEEARLSLLRSKPLGPMRLGCKISRLTDRLSGTSSINMRNVICSPMIRFLSDTLYSILFVVEGFLIEFFIPGIPYRLAKTAGVHQNSPILFAPNIDFLTVPEIVKVLGSAFNKRERGLVHPKIPTRKNRSE